MTLLYCLPAAAVHERDPSTYKCTMMSPTANRHLRDSREQATTARSNQHQPADARLGRPTGQLGTHLAHGHSDGCQGPALYWVTIREQTGLEASLHLYRCR